MCRDCIAIASLKCNDVFDRRAGDVFGMVVSKGVEM